MGKRKTLSQACSKRNWTFVEIPQGHLINTGYEEIRVEYCGEDAFIVSRRVIGGTHNKHITVLNQHVYPSTARNIASNIDKIITIKNEEKYLLYWTNVIAKYCKQLDVCCEYKFGLIYLRTHVEEFYIEPNHKNLEKFELFHRGVDGRSMNNNPYHRQTKTGLTYDNVAKYVHKHTASKYGNIVRGG